MFDIASMIVVTLFFANVALAVCLVFFGRRTPASTWVWLMVLVMLPIIGFLVYLIFGQDIKKNQEFRKKADGDDVLRHSFLNNLHNGKNRKIYDYQVAAFKEKRNLNNADFYSVSLNDLVYYNITADTGILSGNNDVTVFNNGNDKLDTLIEDIKNAKNHIHLLYYIIKNDEAGKRLISALEEKAAEGVRVKLLFDGMGCIRTNKELFKKLKQLGGQISVFFPPSIPTVNIRLNYRNHRKIAVIDGETAYLGGINIGNEYLGNSKSGFWRDMHLRIKGGAVNHLQLRMAMDWNFASDAKVSKIEINENYFPSKDDDFNGVRVQIVSSGPDTRHENIKNAYFKMITEAEKSVYFTTPYFVPDDSILSALKIAALSGIDVRIIFPGKPDHLFVYWASLSYVYELLEAGVRCFQYERGFIHSKMMVVDGVVSSVGTANMDIRSFSLNFETNAVIYSEKIGERLNEQFFEDEKDSFEITAKWYNGTPKIYRVKEAFARLISPIL